jgi:folate-binding Fe-S cluster repair protein YgfZ
VQPRHPAATLKRLSMFVLRAKVKLTDATAQFALYGLAGT